VTATRYPALRFTGPGRYEVTEIVAPVRGDGEALIAPTHVGICATDIELLDGTHPYFEHHLAHYPLQPGHEWSGVVLESDDPRLPAGTHVVGDPEVPCGRPDCEFCSVGRTPWCPDRTEVGCRGGRDGGAAARIVLPTSALRVIPPGVDDVAALLAEPSLTVLGGLHRVGAVNGKSVLIIGAGTLGIISAQVCRHRGAHVTLLETSRPRRDALSGFSTTSGPFTAGSADIVIVAAGSPDAFPTALDAVANGGQIVLLGVPAGRLDGIDVAAILHKDISIHGVLNYSSAGPGTMQLALKLIAERVIDPRQIIDQVISLADAGRALSAARATDRQRPKIVVAIASADQKES
jgi:threonine dehydrogenase-like Zn-dependent dehydrogenase